MKVFSVSYESFYHRYRWLTPLFEKKCNFLIPLKRFSLFLFRFLPYGKTKADSLLNDAKVVKYTYRFPSVFKTIDAQGDSIEIQSP